MLSSANGQPGYAGAGSQAAEKEKLDWEGCSKCGWVFSVWMC